VQPLRQLHGDGSAADHRERRRRTLELEDRLARQEAGLRETVDGWHRRAAPGCQQHVPRPQPDPVDVDGVRVDEAGGADVEVDAEPPDPLGRVVGGGDPLLHLPDPRPHGGRVHLGIDGREPQPVGGAHAVRRPRRRQQRLRGDAARPEAVAADAVALHDRHPDGEPGRQLGCGDPARPHADDDEVVTIRHHVDGTAGRGVIPGGRRGRAPVMTDPRLEDHAIGVELQITELVEKIERARVQGRHERVAELQPQLEALQDELATTAEEIADERWDHAEIHAPHA
jgi:hypothetical protein